MPKGPRNSSEAQTPDHLSLARVQAPDAADLFPESVAFPKGDA
jgi:hypothetical protein